MSSTSSLRTNPSLLRRVKENDRQAWEEFVRRYQPLIWQWCLRFLTHEADREDLAHDVLAKLFEIMRSFEYDPMKSFRGWLYTVTKYTWQGVCKKRHEIPVSQSSELQNLLENIEDRAKSLYGGLTNAFEIEVLEQAEEKVQEKVKPLTWEIYVLINKDGLQPAEVIQRFVGLTNPPTPGAVYMANNRVKAMLQVEVDNINSV